MSTTTVPAPVVPIATSTKTPDPLRAKRRRKLAQWGFLAPAVVFMLLFFGYPLVRNVVMSFQDYSFRLHRNPGQQRLVGLEGVAVVVAAAHEALVAPPEVDLRPVHGRRRRGVSNRLESSDAHSAAREHHCRLTVFVLDIHEFGDEPRRDGRHQDG